MTLKELTCLAMAHPGAGNAKVTAALLQGNRLLAIGYNQRKTHPLAKKFGKNSEAIYLHAEVDAIINAVRVWGIAALRGSTLKVARVLKNGTPALAKPCEGCQRAIIAFEIGEVEWTTSEGTSDD